MKAIETQITFEDINEDYRAFVNKFKPKKTTDDCYTPDNIYNAVIGSGFIVKNLGSVEDVESWSLGESWKSMSRGEEQRNGQGA